MLRSLVKTGAACALYYTGVDELSAARAGLKNMPLVIGYHRVTEDFRASAARSIPAMLTSARMLERHLDWIGQRFHFITLDELASRLGEGRGFDKPAAAVTFDDGYSDVYHHAFPLLRRKGIPATVFVVTNLVGTSDLQTHDRLYLLLSRAFSVWRHPRWWLTHVLLCLGIHLPAVRAVSIAGSDPARATSALLRALPQAQVYRVMAALRAEIDVPQDAPEELRPLSWDMLSEMHRMGITVGSHTKTHAVLTNETWPTVVQETRGSRREAQHRLGIPIRHFAYPDGRFNVAIVRAVAAAGYRCAYTTCGHRDPAYPLLTIPRRLLWERSCLDVMGRFSPALMSCQVRGVFDAVSRCRQEHRRAAVPA